MRRVSTSQLRKAAAADQALTGLWFIGQKHYPVETGGWVYQPDYPLFKELRDWLSGYFNGRNVAFKLNLRPMGTMFQLEVWDMLKSIPFGQVATYGDIAGRISAARGGVRVSARAVGNAVSHNPLSIVIPCHRVIGADRKLTGYAGGLDKKLALLKIEGIEFFRDKAV